MIAITRKITVHLSMIDNYLRFLIIDSDEVNTNSVPEVLIA